MRQSVLWPFGSFWVLLKHLRQAKGLFLCLCIGTLAEAQSVFLFEYKLVSDGGDSVDAAAMLTIFSGGEAVARVRYSAAGTDQLVEVALVDSVVEGIGTKTGQRILLAQNANPILSDGNQFAMPAFVFGKMTVKNQVVYEPNDVFTKNSSGDWQRARTTTKKWCAFTTLTPELVGVFYSPEEEHYKNIFRIGTRGLPANEKKARLFLIAVANTVDDSIKESCRRDLFNCIELYRNLAKGLDIPLVPRSVFGKGFSKSGVEAAVTWVAAQKPGGNDILVFYYSGHGFRLPEDKTKFPYMSLRTRDDQGRMANAINVEQLYNRLIGFGARMTIVISDCCNEKVDAQPSRGPDALLTKSTGVPLSIENCRALFFPEKKGSILVTSADIDQLASGNPTMGGYFSHHFKAALEGYTSTLKTDVNWLQLLSEVRRNTARKALEARCFEPKIPCPQYPWFAIRL